MIYKFRYNKRARNGYHLKIRYMNYESLGYYYLIIFRLILLNIIFLIYILVFIFQETEEILSNLVVNKTVWAKVDRLAGVISFSQQKDPSEVLNDWSHDLNKLMQLLSKTTHLINKEEMVHKHLMSEA